VQVDEAGTDDEASAIDRLTRALDFQFADPDNPIPAHGDVTLIRLTAGTVDNRASLEQNIDVAQRIGPRALGGDWE
jgi:hypothetical protein